MSCTVGSGVAVSIIACKNMVAHGKTVEDNEPGILCII